MPNLDYFLLDRFGLDGPSGAKYKSVLLSTDNAVTAVIVPAQTTNAQVQNLVTLEAGTKLITVGVGNVSGGPWQMTSYNSSNVLMRFVLFDSAAVPWFLHDAGALQANYSVASITIDLVGGIATTLQASGDYGFNGSSSGAGWRGVYYTRPGNFNANGPLYFAVCGTNSTQNNGNGNFKIANMRLISL